MAQEKIVKVLHIIDTYVISGPGKTIVNSWKYSRNSRYQKYLAVFTSPFKRNLYLDYAMQLGMPVYGISERHKYLPGFISTLISVFRLRKIIRENSFDVVHTHGYKSDIVGFLVSIVTKVELVTTYHGFIDNTRRAKIYNWLSIMASSRMKKVIAVSDKMKARLVKMGIREEKIVVIRNSIVVEDYPVIRRSTELMEKLGVARRDPIIGCIGRVSPEKGQFVLCEAFTQVFVKFPNACLIIIGDGPDIDALKQKYVKYANNIIFTGHVHDVKEYIGILDLHVLPSFTEGLPNVVLETACMGVVNVATAVGGTPECLVDGTTGTLVTPGDPDGLAAAVIEILSNKQKLIRYSKDGISFVHTNYNFNIRVKQMENFYAQLLNEQ